MSYKRSDADLHAILAGEHGSLVDTVHAAVALGDIAPGSLLRQVQRGTAAVMPAIRGARPRFAVNDLRSVHRLDPLTAEEFKTAQQSKQPVSA